MTLAVVAEKPAVARDIAQVLGARTREEGCLRGEGYVVTWAIGHLVGLAEPHELNPRWKEWRMAELPMLPDDWRLVVSESTSDQFANVRRVLQAPDVTGVICATDAGREGELIFRYIYEAARCTSRCVGCGSRRSRRTQSPGAFASFGTGASTTRWRAPLARAAGRIGSRDEPVAGLQHRGTTTCSPWAACRRRRWPCSWPGEGDRVVRPRGLHRGRRDLRDRRSGARRRTPARGFGANLGASRRTGRGVRDRARVSTGEARIESVEREVHRVPPPLLYDLTELQRHANRLYGMSAQRTLDVAQALYERRKLLSYPRTDSRRLTHAIAETLPEVVRAIADPYRAPRRGTGSVRWRRASSTTRGSPTTTPSSRRRPGPGRPRRRRATHLRPRVPALARRMARGSRYAVTKVVTRVTSGEVERSRARARASSGWDGRCWTSGRAKQGGRAKVCRRPPRRGRGRRRRRQGRREATRPPPRFTDATLLTAMETAGRGLPEKEIADAVRSAASARRRRAPRSSRFSSSASTRTRRKVPAGDRQGRRAHRRRTRERQIARDDRRVEAQLAHIEHGTADFDTFMAASRGTCERWSRASRRGPRTLRRFTRSREARWRREPRCGSPQGPTISCRFSENGSASRRTGRTRKRHAALRRSGATCSS